jgi:3-hydroxyisobutyrate dehydrogenase-like beta-hydroxyacid dehydrogenase
MKPPAIGFIGFGEAAFWIARGLRGRGITDTVAYDLHAQTPARGDIIQQRAREAGTRLLMTLCDTAAAADIVVSAVTASEARSVGEQAAAHIEPRQIYVDINSASPAAKQAIDRAVTARGARFVEAAVMSTVPPLGHEVPMLLCGSGAAAFADLMTPYGMRLEVLDGVVGSASAIKMFRSVIIKGLEALMLECLLGAEQFGASERVFASVSASFPGLDWNQLAHYLIGRTAIHAERRVHEMEEVARTLADVGVEPIMASATVRRLKTCADLDLKSHFGNQEPADYRDVLHAIAQRSGR